jgi:hypothetical protein
MVAGFAALAAAVVCLQAPSPAPVQESRTESPPTVQPSVDVTPLRFDEMLVATPRALEPSVKLKSLNGKRVRLVGYMAYQEAPPMGAFFLCPRPTHNDEGGAGTADLPPVAVLVVVRSAKGKQLEHIPRPVEVTGVLDLGRQEEEDGTISFVRLILDRPEDAK